MTQTDTQAATQAASQTANQTRKPKPYGQAKLGKIRAMLGSLTKTREISASLVGDVKSTPAEELELASLATDEAETIVREIKEAGFVLRKEMQRIEREMAAVRSELSRIDQHASETVREIASHARTAAGELERRAELPAQDPRANPVPDSGDENDTDSTQNEHDEQEQADDETQDTERASGDAADAEESEGESLPGLD